MDNDKNSSVYRALVRVRQVFDDALHPNTSLIAIDLLLETAARQPGGRTANELTVKQLFAQLRHSDRAARIHFNRLVADGLLATEPGRGDRRTKLVRLTPAGESLLRRAASAFSQTLAREAKRSGPTAAGRREAQKGDGLRPNGEVSRRHR